MDHETLLKYNDERESLAVPFDMMRHGVMVDISPTIYGGKKGMTIEGEHIPWEYDHEKLYLKIYRPNNNDIETLDTYEVTSPNVYHATEEEMVHITKKTFQFKNIPLNEWRKRLEMEPLPVIKKTLEATTQNYVSVEI